MVPFISLRTSVNKTADMLLPARPPDNDKAVNQRDGIGQCIAIGLRPFPLTPEGAASLIARLVGRMPIFINIFGRWSLGRID
jgi:hypothetical protein